MTTDLRHALVPRAALLGIALAVVSHTAAVVTSLTSVQAIPAWHWATLLISDACLAAVVIRRSEWFLTRNFRLPGIFVVTTCVLILVPLPATVRRYGFIVPHQTVLAIAAGLAAFAIVTYLLTARAPTPLHVQSGPSDSMLAWAIVVLSVILLPIWIRSIGSVPFFELFGSTNALTAAGERDRALNSLSNGALRAAVGGLRNLYLMFATGYLVSRAATTTRDDWRALTRWRTIALGALGIASLYALVTTERAILGELVIVSVVAWLASRRKRLSVRHVAVSSVIGISFPVMYAILVGAGGFATSLNGLKRRIFYLPDDVMLHYFIEFPRFHAFLHGSSIPKWGRITGTPTFDLSSLIYDKFYKVDASLTGIANGSFLGVGWANWGTVGVIAWCVVAAVAVVFAERILRSFPTTSSAALRGVAVVQTALLTSSDLSRSLIGFLPGFLDIVAILWIVRKIDQRLGKIRRVNVSGRRASATRPLSRRLSGGKVR